MNSWKQPPKQALVAQYVDCYWFLEKMSSDTGVDYPKLNPDPSATLIIAPKNQSYHFDLHNNVTEGMGCHMLMPNTSVITMDHTHPFLISGIKFKVGAVYPLKFNQTYPLVNNIVNNEECLPTKLHPMSIQKLSNNNTEQITHTCNSLDQWL